jgi:hypothetical protein
MKQLVALVMVASSALAYGAIAGPSVSATSHQVAGFGQRVVQIEQAVRTLPCALDAVGPHQPGCPDPTRPTTTP